VRNKTLGNISECSPLQSETVEFIMGNKEMAEELNLYFASVFTKEDMNHVPEVLIETGFSEELKEINVSTEMDLGKLMGLKVDKSPGPDNLQPRVFVTQVI